MTCSSRILPAALMILAPILARADADFERTVPVAAQPALFVSTGSGSVRVFLGSDAQIHIKAHLHANGSGFGGHGEVDERIRRIVANPPIQQSGNTVRVGEADDRSLYNNISIDYEITAPRTVALDLRTGSGEIEVDNLGRFLKAQSGSGSVRAHGLSGPADMQTGSGDIELQEQAPGDVHATTGSGSIRVQGLDGGFKAQTGSGDIEAGGHVTSASNLQTGSGSVRLHLGRDARFNLQAAASSGTLRVPLPGMPPIEGRSQVVNAPINGGGPAIKIHTGSGDIEIN